jgi:hydroxymethylpyrimidine pyrophosphatase-like HAD family hydrolase
MQRMAIQDHVSVEALLLDYDGTISPLHVSRAESQVPSQIQVALKRISQRIPVVVVTSKAPDFVIPRTPFATAWSTINGLETRIGESVFNTSISKLQLEMVSAALKYAKARLAAVDVDIEEKRLSSQQVVGFCVDWRRSTDLAKAKRAADRVARRLRALQLYVCGFEDDPFYDVYCAPAHKGRAVEAIRERLGLKSGVAFMGDSEMDNPAFLLSDLSLGVLHEDSQPRPFADCYARFEDLAYSLQSNLSPHISHKASRPRLCCDYWLRFEDVADFLEELWEKGLVFNSGFSSLKSFGE